MQCSHLSVQQQGPIFSTPGFEPPVPQVNNSKDPRHIIISEQKPRSAFIHCLRPYHAEYTGSRPITEVKQRRAGLVLGWVTAWE